MNLSRSGPGLALAAAALFGLSAPAAKLLAGTVDPWLLAGLLYLGSGIGLGWPGGSWDRWGQTHR